MTRYLIGAAALALFATTPASAQLLGGGGGGLGGGLGGSLGGMGGSLGGSAGGMIGRGPIQGDTIGRATSTTRADRQVRARKNAVDASGSVAGTSALQARNANVATTGTVSGDAALGARTVETRGIVAAERRGLRRVAQTGSGVPVFVSQSVAAAPAIVATTATRAYPVYDRSVYYGGADVVVVPSGEVGGYMDRQYHDLQRGMEGTGATVFRRGTDLVVQLPADVTFAFDRADIRPRFLDTLSALARTLDAYDGTDVEIIGHTDAVGSDAYNLALSERRGRSVADFLVARDTAPDRLVVEAMGKSEPIATNATVEGRAANRRVEIVLHPRSA